MIRELTWTRLKHNELSASSKVAVHWNDQKKKKKKINWERIKHWVSGVPWKMRCSKGKSSGKSFLFRFLKTYCFSTQNSVPQETSLLRTVKPTAWVANAVAWKVSFTLVPKEEVAIVSTSSVLCSKIQRKCLRLRKAPVKQWSISKVDNGIQCEKEEMTKASFSQSTESLWNNLGKDIHHVH